MPLSSDDVLRLQIKPARNGSELLVRVVPGASRSRVVGRHGDALRLSVAAVAEGGKANAAVIALLAKTLGLRRNQVEILHGLTSRSKRVAIEQFSPVEIQIRLIGV